MHDDASLRINNVSDAVLADLGLSHNVPHWLKIELDNAHASVPPPTGHSHGYVGLRLAAHVDRPVIDLLGHRLCEFRFLGIVSAAANDIHGQTRYLEVLLA